MNPVIAGRLGNLLDTGSFHPLDAMDRGELVGGTGEICGRRVCVIAIDPEYARPEDPFDVLRRELALLDMAGREKIPLVHLADRPARVDKDRTAIPSHLLETFISSRGAGRVFARFARLSGIVPRVAVVFGRIATTLTYPVAECDTVIMTENAGMSLGRPDMVRLMTGDRSPYAEYGGARMHAEVAGTCDILAVSEKEALGLVRRYLGYFPSWYGESPPVTKARPVAGPGQAPIQIPDDPNLPYDMHGFIACLADQGSFLEHRALYAGELITGFARVDGIPFGIIASNSHIHGGILFPDSCRKLSTFATLCDAFSLPIVFLADIPGFMVGKEAEQAGIIQHGALVFSVLANLSVPHLTVVVRKAYTAGYYAMGGAGFDPDRIIALPESDIAIYGRKGLDLLARDQDLTPGERASVLASARHASCARRHYENGHLDGIVDGDNIRPEVKEFLSRAYRAPVKRTGPIRVLCL